MKRFFLLALFLVPQLVFARSACAPLFPVAMSLQSELSSTVTSASVGFHAVLRNQSTALIHDARLAVQVADKKSGVVVDRFVTTGPVTLLESSTGKVDFVWKVPSGLPSDIYTVTVRLISASTTRASAFIPDIEPFASRDITISGGIPQASVSAVSVNGSMYRAGQIVRIEGESAQAVAATLNGTSAPFKGTLTWRLYSSDASLSDKPLDTEAVPVQLHPNTSTNVVYTLKDAVKNGYYLEGELSDGRGSSYVDVWLARDPNVFAQLQCAGAHSAPAPASSNAPFVIGGTVVLLVLAAAWRFYEYHKVA